MSDTRRGFLKAIGAMVAATVVGPPRLGMPEPKRGFLAVIVDRIRESDALTGHSGDIIIIDDPYDDREVSPEERESMAEWWRETMAGRHFSVPE